MSLELRHCLKDPIPEIEEAAKKLSQAADAHLQGDSETVRHMLVETNMPSIRAWTESIWSKTPALSPDFKPFKLAPKNKDFPGQRLAGRDLQSQLHERDGHRCRFCGIPVIHADIRKLFHRAYPEIQVWGRTNLSQHAAFQAMWAQYDHLVPFRRGGTTSLENMVVTCAPCNFGRMQYLVEEVGLSNPLERKPFRDGWDGLRRLS